MAELVFFYGTLMTPFNRTGLLRLDRHLSFKGRGTIRAALFDLGIYPAAVPASDSQVTGEVYELTEPVPALRALDELEGYRPGDPETSLYTRTRTPVALDDGTRQRARARRGRGRRVCTDVLAVLPSRTAERGRVNHTNAECLRSTSTRFELRRRIAIRGSCHGGHW